MRRWPLPILCAWLLAALPLPALAKPQAFRFDPVHTQVMFSISHLGFSNPVGRFPGISGGFTFDRDDWTASAIDATIEVGSLYLGDAAWQKKVLSDAFFDAQRHPTMRFVSKRVERTGDDRGIVHGALTLRGVTRPVVLEVTLNRIGRHSFSLRYVAGFSASATIRRSDFGMTRLLPAVGDEVRIRLEVEGVRDQSLRDGGRSAGPGTIAP